MILKAPSSLFIVSSKYAHHTFLGSFPGVGSCRPPSSSLFCGRHGIEIFLTFYPTYSDGESTIWEIFQSLGENLEWRQRWSGALWVNWLIFGIQLYITFAYNLILGEKEGVSYTIYQVQTIYDVIYATWGGKEKATIGTRERKPFFPSRVPLCLHTQIGNTIHSTRVEKLFK